MLTFIRAAIVGAAALAFAPSPHHAEPETVVIMLHARAGADSALRAVIDGHWSEVRRLQLVENSPHLTLEGTEENGRVYFVEIFTWRSADTPDNAPAAVRAWWDKMAALTESRPGRPGIEIRDGLRLHAQE